VIKPISPTIVEEKNLMTEELDVDMQGETQNPSTKKNPTQKLGLGTEKPHVEPNEEDDEIMKFDEVQYHVAEPTQ
jgi:hypothetical protein